MVGHSNKTDCTSLARRLWVYQQERFPLSQYAPTVAVFTFSAAAYSRLLRRAPGFIRWDLFAVGVFTALAFFFMLRVLDEHKDAATDRRYRAELPVPRGVVTLMELRWVSALTLAAAIIGNALLAPSLLWPCLLAAVWAALMTREFFVGAWLRAHPTAYLISHMAVMPMIDGYTTGLDWLAAGTTLPGGLTFFLAVTFLNGTVIEIGRKIRAPESEREGVDTYTKIWGVRAAPLIWLAVLGTTAGCAWLAARFAGAGALTAGLLIAFFLAAAFPAARFWQTRSARWAKRMEMAGGFWTLGMYLVLGAGPFLARWFGH